MTDTNTQDTPTPETPQSIVARVAPSWWIRAALVTIMMLGLGLWGIYDYAVDIPRREQMSQRRHLAETLVLALTPNEDRILANEKFQTALVLIETAQAANIPGEDSTWDETLTVWMTGLQTVARGGEMNSELKLQVGLRIEQALLEYGDVQEPAAYDRPVQWMFISSLIFVPFYAWGLIKYAPRVYRLDPDGTVHLPQEKLAAGDIEDIDMNRWMSKSTAELVATDGRRIKLDAFIFKNLHLIVGAVAHRLHPENWTSEAKLITPEEPDSDSGAGDEAED